MGNFADYRPSSEFTRLQTFDLHDFILPSSYIVLHFFTRYATHGGVIASFKCTNPWD
jgi:hypothetical protein